VSSLRRPHALGCLHLEGDDCDCWIEHEPDPNDPPMRWDEEISDPVSWDRPDDIFSIF
jgi:hypothetical protein